VAETANGTLGTVPTVSAADSVEVSESPTELLAITVNVYSVPLKRLLIEMGLFCPVALVDVPWPLVGVAVTVYLVTGAPPSSSGGVNVTSTAPLPLRLMATAVGALGRLLTQAP
jgi:hypothetical protein